MTELERLSRKILIDELQTLRAQNKHLLNALNESNTRRRVRDKLVRDYTYEAIKRKEVKQTC